LPTLFRIVILVVALLNVQPALAGDVVDRIVAQVNGEIITLFDLNEQMKPILEQFKGRELADQEKAALITARKNVLEQMVQDILLKQQIDKLGVTVTETEILNEFESVKQRSKLSDEEFEAQLKLQGMTADDYKKRLGTDIQKHRLLGVMVKRKVVVSDEEVRQYFEEHKDKYKQDKKVELAVILVPAVDEAEIIRKGLADGGMTFEQAAAKYSKGPGAQQGGNIGTLDWSTIAPAWRDALEGVEPGGLSKVFELNGMGALLKLVSVTEGKTSELDDEMMKSIQQELYQQQLDARFREYMEQLRSQAVVEINL